MAKMRNGLDMSKYQGVSTAERIAKIVEQGIEFVYVRFSSGGYYKDPQAENNTALLQEAGRKVGPYHFTTLDNATSQLNNFIAAVKDFQFDIPPAQDCEAYTTVGGEVYSIRELRMMINSPQLLGAHAPWMKPATANMLRLSDKAGIFENTVRAMYGLTYPTYAIVDSIGGTDDTKGLTAWMKQKQTKLSAFKYPGIYTNASSGNTIFPYPATLKMNRYALWVANWRVPVPNPPKIWQGKPYMAWQNDVIDGRPYGIDGQVDHDFWGDETAYPFPGDVTPPPPTDEWFDVVATHHPSGKIYTGKMLPEVS